MHRLRLSTKQFRGQLNWREPRHIRRILPGKLERDFRGLGADVLHPEFVDHQTAEPVKKIVRHVAGTGLGLKLVIQYFRLGSAKAINMEPFAVAGPVEQPARAMEQQHVMAEPETFRIPERLERIGRRFFVSDETLFDVPGRDAVLKECPALRGPLCEFSGILPLDERKF